MKKLVSLLFVFLISLISLQPISATNQVPVLYSQYAYLYDPTTKIVYLNENSDERIYPASMTKVLTVSVSLDKIKDLSQTVKIIKQDFAGLAAAGAAVAKFNPGETVTYKDLIYGALLPSGADACNILARTLFGSYENMVDAMNAKIKSLQLTNTHFTNVTGLHDENHYTTVKEMALILEDALKNEDFVEAFNTKSYQDSLGKRTWTSTLARAESSKQLDITSLTGAKSGYTDEAQLTLACTMNIKGQQLILITAKADGQRTQNHVRDAVALAEYMNNNYDKFILYKKDETIHQGWVLKSFHGVYSISAEKQFSILINNTIDEKDIDMTYEGDLFLSAPIKAKQCLGKIIVSYQDSVLYEYQVLADRDIDRSIIAEGIQYFLLIIVPLSLIYLVIKKIKSK